MERTHRRASGSTQSQTQTQTQSGRVSVSGRLTDSHSHSHSVAGNTTLRTPDHHATHLQSRLMRLSDIYESSSTTNSTETDKM
jgi:hypothetical protein